MSTLPFGLQNRPFNPKTMFSGYFFDIISDIKHNWFYVLRISMCFFGKSTAHKDVGGKDKVVYERNEKGKRKSI